MEVAGDSTIIKAQQILNLPIPARCDGIGHLVNECSHKELQVIFPLVVESLFGVKNQVGWGLRTICRTSPSNPHDFQVLYQFLHPHGTMFRLIYKLLIDCYLKYEFPLTILPVGVRKMFEDGVLPHFYVDKLNIDSQTKVTSSLALNPFEFYMFHFANHLVNPWLIKFSGSVPWENVYVHMCEEYLTHFLPCAGSAVSPLIDYHVVKSPIPHHQAASRPTRTPTIFKQSVMNKVNTSGSMHSSPVSPQLNPHLEIWRSEVVIQSFVDLWLSYGNKDAANYCSVRELPPSVDHVRTVRNMVKHFHYFSNSSMGDMSAMEELRRVIGPSTHARIYSFLRHTMQDWPLDSSFRLILETWLSYIQPWRYTDYRSLNKGTKEPEEKDRSIDRIWLNFIAENLFAYAIIYQQLLPRFARLDLTTPKNANMLFRVTKVFSQPQLNIMLAEVEFCIKDEVRYISNNEVDICYPLPPTPTENMSLDSIVENSPTVVAMGQKWHGFLRQQLLDLEGPNFEYCPVFHGDSDRVKLLLDMVVEACFTAKLMVRSAENSKQNQPWSLLSILRDVFFSTSLDAYEISLEERRRVVAYLETSLQQLASMYRVVPPKIPDTNAMSILDANSYLSSGMSHLHQSASMNETYSEKRYIVTPHYKIQQKPVVSYEGDPDLQPIRSTECAFLVRVLHQIASKINEMYSVEMYNLFSRDDFCGNITRQILCPPLVIRTYDKNIPGRFSPLVETVLPPRLSLRWLANHRLLGYLLTAMAVSMVLGYKPTVFVVTTFGLWFLYIIARALCEPVLLRLDDNTSPQMHISDVSGLDLSASFTD